MEEMYENKDYLRLLYGIRGYIRFTREHNTNVEETLSTIMHDINGVLSKQPIFSPRVDDYVSLGENQVNKR